MMPFTRHPSRVSIVSTRFELSVIEATTDIFSEVSQRDSNRGTIRPVTAQARLQDEDIERR